MIGGCPQMTGILQCGARGRMNELRLLRYGGKQATQHKSSLRCAGAAAFGSFQAASSTVTEVSAPS